MHWIIRLWWNLVGWLLVKRWYLDPEHGDDSNDGRTRQGALRTAEELFDRRLPRTIGPGHVVVTVLSDLDVPLRIGKQFVRGGRLFIRGDVGCVNVPPRLGYGYDSFKRCMWFFQGR